MKDEFIVHVAGHTQGNLICDSLDCLCGNIEHGLGFRFAIDPSGHRFAAGWVVSFDDLEKVYLAAKDYRAKQEKKV
jgi:hypothetical protein